MTWDVLKHLYHRAHVVAPSPASDLSAFAFDDYDRSPSFYLDRVRWLLLPTLSEIERVDYLRAVDEKLRSDADTDELEFEVQELWHQIVKYEAMEYWEHKLSQLDVWYIR